MKKVLKGMISTVFLVAFVAVSYGMSSMFWNLRNSDRVVKQFIKKGEVIHVDNRNCEGVIKYNLGHGYYFVDKLWCQVSNGYAIAEPAEIVHHSEIYQLWEKMTCIDGSVCYGPVTDESPNRGIRKAGKWVSK